MFETSSEFDRNLLKTKTHSLEAGDFVKKEICNK